MSNPANGNSLILRGALVLDSEQLLVGHSVVVRGNRISGIVPDSCVNGEGRVIDLAERYLAPGFIDLQINGCGGVLFNDAIDEKTLAAMHRTNLRSGTTNFFPTLITTTEQEMGRALEVVEHYRARNDSPVIGLHLEGPYINPDRKGIHNPHRIRTPSPEMIEQIIFYAAKFRVMLTLAPERVDLEVIRRLTENGVIVSCGHSNATYEEAMAGFDAGVRHVTHLFNAMSPWTSRDPGVVGAALERSAIDCGLIADGVHVHFASLSLAKRLKQEHCYFVTDAVTATGTEMTSFDFGGQKVFVRDHRCVNRDGVLGGSLATMIKSVSNGVRHLGLTLVEATRMATLYPARVAGVEHELGRIAEGYLANFAVFDQDFNLTDVIEGADWVFTSRKE